MRSFPESFVFGCATSAYQIEGHITNDWTQWESLGRLKDPQARCGVATDHWNRWRDDFALLSSVGAGAYRLSIEWSRVEPSPGIFDRAALDRYSAMIDELRARKIEPFVTLLHFTHPTWFHERTPWHDPEAECVKRFEAFTREVDAAIGDRVRYWTVLNEPGAWLVGGYLAGLIPPGIKGLRALAAAFTNLARAHAAAHRVLSPGGAKIGIAHNVLRFVPARSSSPLDRLAAGYVARHYNHAFPEALITGRSSLGVVPGVRAKIDVPEAKGTLDFLGVNYYSRVFLELAPFSKNKVPVAPFYEDRGGHGLTDLGWEIYPDGLTEALLDMNAYRLPMYITENGLDDRDDSRRSAFLYDHLGAVLTAIDRGADVRGYLHWSLLDNFEWLEGFGPRFGLFSVDYQTLERRPTKAAELFERISRARALPAERPPVTPKRGSGPVPLF